ncbi:MAG: hypothetical protein EAZ62_09065 [Sphingobacteriia bacterium]|nr:MAG: hypothetical protein EAZ62_09065 [Sphingobacteriia bacterium]
MKLIQEKVLLHLNGHAEWSDLKSETAEKLVQEFPFFAPAQFLLAAKLYRDNHPLANDQAAKTLLYFNNPLFLQYQLSGLKESRIDQAPETTLDTALLRSIHQKDKEWDALMAETQAPPNQPIVIPTIESVRAMMQNIHGTDPISGTAETNEVEPAPAPSNWVSAMDPVAAIDPVPPIDPISAPDPALPIDPIEPIAIVDPWPSFESSASPSAADQGSVDFFTPVAAPGVQQDQEKGEAKIASLVAAQLAAFKKPVEPAETLEIDGPEKSLHTVDYFGSQGIFLDLTKIPQDKLTTQLRKFTDWLKDMKSYNPQAIDLGTSPESEKAVAETALVSNESREILTETMAEVLAKQGQMDKAIQLYIKLSFSNPEKSAYFAAKIEQLKGI